MHPNVRPCRHLFTDGHQCGSPALRGEPLCFNHHSARRPLQHQTLHGHTTIAFPEPLDLHAVQRGLAELLRLTAAQTIDLKLAAALHRTLSTAGQNLDRIERSDARAQARAQALGLPRAPVTDYINHPTLGTLAREPQPEPTNPPGAPRLASETSAPSLASETSAPTLAPTPDTTGSPAHPLSSSQADLQTVVRLPRQTLQTPLDLQTQPLSNEDLETSLQSIPEHQAPEHQAPEHQAPEHQAPGPQPEAPEAPLPDPVHRFTLPPVLENLPSQQALDAANLHYAQALETMAQGIHTRAQTRAQLHATLYPLVDDTEADHRLLDLHPQLQAIIHTLENQPTP